MPGKVTVSTNMAGRGTDIKLGAGVAELGGLHVILTEMHDAARIDRQLSGRCGRQGDPGTYPPVPGPGRRPAAGRPGTEEGRPAQGPRREGRRPARSPRAASSARPRARSSAATSASAGALMYFEKERKKMQRQMGQDPYLDTPGS